MPFPVVLGTQPHDIQWFGVVTVMSFNAICCATHFTWLAFQNALLNGSLNSSVGFHLLWILLFVCFLRGFHLLWILLLICFYPGFKLLWVLGIACFPCFPLGSVFGMQCALLQAFNFSRFSISCIFSSLMIFKVTVFTFRKALLYSSSTSIRSVVMVVDQGWILF